TRKRRPGHVQMTVWPERQMIGSHARFESREACPFTDLVHNVNRAAAVTHEHSPFGVKGDARSDPKITGKLFGFLKRRHPVDCSVIAAGDKHLSTWTEGETSRIDHVSEKGLALAIGSDLVNR